jgi:hypothetical protein
VRVGRESVKKVYAEVWLLTGVTKGRAHAREEVERGVSWRNEGVAGTPAE